MTDINQLRGIHVAALTAAQTAAEQAYARVGERDAVGFAWVIIRPARGPFVSHLKSINFGRYPGYDRKPSYGIWYSDLHNVPTQSMSVHEAAVKAYVEVLTANGIPATWNSRMD